MDAESGIVIIVVAVLLWCCVKGKCCCGKGAAGGGAAADKPAVSRAGRVNMDVLEPAVYVDESRPLVLREQRVRALPPASCTTLIANHCSLK